MVVLRGVKKGLGVWISKKLGRAGAPDPRDIYGIYQVRTRFNRRTQVKEVFYTPTNPQTAPQQANRQNLANIVAEWQGLTDEQKDYYNKLKAPTGMSGYNRYIRFCMLTPSGPDCPMPGQILYDAVVAPTGGDYTSIVAACAAEAAGATIFIRSGTYVETADIVMKNGQKLIGENKFDVIIDFNNAAYQIRANNLANGIEISNLTIQNSIDTSGAIYAASSHYCRFSNLRILAGTTKTHGIYYTGNYCILENSYIYGFTGSTHYGAYLYGNYCRIHANYFGSCYRALRTGYYAEVFGNTFYATTDSGVYAGQGNLITGNYFFASSNMGVYAIRESTNITGNVFNCYNGVYIKGPMCSVSGNIFLGSSNLYLYSGYDLYASITGNSFNTGRITCYGNYNTIVGNTFKPSGSIVDGGKANTIRNNTGTKITLEKDFRRMKNTSGGALVAGDVVILKSVAAGDEITTTTIEGDPKVFGMLEENIANNASGYIQILGKTVRLKVNGIDDIAIGDFIGTFTSAGIGKKATAGDMAFAIALEAYATDDSNGIIDALLVTPRKL